MTTIAEIKAQYPDLTDSSDDQVVDALHQAFYSDLPRDQIAAKLGVKPAAAAVEPSGNLRRLVGDSAVSLAKGAIAVPEAAVGLADLASGGRVGKFLENEGGAVGFRPKQARAALDEFLTPEQQAANKTVQDASVGQPGDDQGLMSKVGRVGMAALKNPSVIGHSVLESLPLMGAGGVLARGGMALAPKVGAATAAGVGEGLVTMGSQAESIRQETPDGLLTARQALLAAGSGALTGAIGIGANKLAGRLGLEDIDVLIAGGHASAAAKAGLVKRVVGGAVSEGLLEELPQSVQEQVAQNMALGKPFDEGVDQAIVMGVLSGGLMGSGAQLFHGKPAPKTAGDVIREDLQLDTGPLSNAVNTGIEKAAQAADAAMPATADQAPHMPREANAAMIAAIRKLDPEQQQNALDLVTLGNRMDVAPGVRRFAQNRLDAILGDGAPLNPAEKDAKTGAPLPAETPTVAEAKPGNEADQQLARQESDLRRTEAEALAQREADRPEPPKGEPQEGDILNTAGKPFTTMPGASRALTKAGEGFEIVRVTRGLVVRPIKQESDDGLGQPADAGRDQGAAPAVAAAPSGNGGVVQGEPARGQGSGSVAEPVAGAAAPVAADGLAGGVNPALTQPNAAPDEAADPFAVAAQRDTARRNEESAVAVAKKNGWRAKLRDWFLGASHGDTISDAGTETTYKVVEKTRKDGTKTKTLLAVDEHGEPLSEGRAATGIAVIGDRVEGLHDGAVDTETNGEHPETSGQSIAAGLGKLMEEGQTTTTSKAEAPATTQPMPIESGRATAEEPGASAPTTTPDDLGAAWTRMTTADRHAAIVKAGWKHSTEPKVNLVGDRISRMAWDKMPGNVQAKLAAVLGGEPAPAPTAPKPDQRSAIAKAKRKFNVETDSVLEAIAKMGGIRRDIMAKEFGLKPEELKHTVPVGGLKGYPFRANGGADMDSVITNLQEAGYFAGVADEDVRTAFEEAVYAEMRGDKTLITEGQMLAAQTESAENAAEQFELDAKEEAEYEAMMREADLPIGSDDILSDDTIDFGASNVSTRDAMQALGFSEQEISDAIASQASGKARSEAPGSDPETLSVADREAQAPGAADRQEARPAPADEGLTLTAPTKAQVLAQQAALEQEQADKNAPADTPASKLTGEQVDIFNPQGSVFDVPAEASPEPSAKPSAKPSPAPSPTTTPAPAPVEARAERPADLIDLRKRESVLKQLKACLAS